MRATATWDGVDSPVFSAVPEEFVVFVLRTMGPIDSQTLVHFRVFVLTLLEPTAEEERKDPSGPRISNGEAEPDGGDLYQSTPNNPHADR